MRITWIIDGVFKAVNLFMHLSQCDPAKHNQKGAEATAEKLLEFLFDKMDLKDYLSSLTFTSDFAIYGKIIEAMAHLGSDLK